MDASPVPHPTDQTLSSYGLGKLDDRSAGAVNDHLEGCPECRRRVAGMSSDSFLDRVRDARKGSGESTSGQPLPGGTQGYKGANTQPAPPAETLPPGLADHPDYQVKRELGRGGMGVVYLAHNTLMGRDEVLKVMGRQIIERPGVLDRFLREIRAVARLRHPNIVTAYSATRVGESIVFAMEYVEGLDLSKLVKAKGPLPVAHACHFAHQAALGLQHAHEEGLVHRDIKPANLMLARKGEKATVKVLDFGLAKVTREEKVDGGLTSQGQSLGTPDFIAPEQILDAQGADIRADIYSLGGTLYYLLSGRPPFKANSLYDMYQAHISRDADPLNLVRPEVPSELAALVAKMMAKDPDRRFQTPGEVAQALAPFFKKGGLAFQGGKVDVSRVDPTNAGRSAAGGLSAPTQSATDVGRPAAPAAKSVAPTVAESRWESMIDLKAAESPVEARPAPAPVKRPPWVWPSVAVGVLTCGLLAAWLGGVFKVRTSSGVIVLENVPEGAEVLVDGDTITFSWPGLDKPVRVRAVPGQRKVEVKKGGFKTFGEVVTVAADGTEEVTVRLEPLATDPVGPKATDQVVEKSDEAREPPRTPVPSDSTRNSVGMTLKLIPAGDFSMGIGDDPETVKALYPWPDIQQARPQHRVRITRPFYLGACEVTQEQYEKVMGSNPSIHGGSSTLPVDAVTWLDAISFCNRLSVKEKKRPYYRVDGGTAAVLGGDGYRLPTEAEWEFACRAGSQWVFPHGNDWRGNLTRAWMNYNSKKTTHPVGELTPNKFGLYDTLGNVSEWCWDWAGPYGDDAGITVDPSGPSRGDARVARGGCFNWNTTLLFTAWQRGFVRNFGENPGHFGFRVASSAADAGGPPAVPVESPAIAQAVAQAAPTPGEMITTNSGLRYRDLNAGRGGKPAPGQTWVIHYTGWLWQGGEKGKKFDSSVDRGRAAEFRPGEVIKGWAEGVSDMKVGGRRLLLVPPSLAYGDKGAGGVIPPGATLLFEIELLALKPANPLGQASGGTGDMLTSVMASPVQSPTVTPPEPHPADCLQPGSVWVSEPGNFTFTVLGREGERFTARFVVGKQVREVNGTIKDGRLRWLARDVKVIAGKQGGDNQGEIQGDQIAMTWANPGGPPGRPFMLRIKEHAPAGPASKKASRPAPRRPQDAKAFLGRFYKVFPLQLTWHEARLKCQAMGGHLAVVTSEEQNRFLTALVSDQGVPSVWLGATDEKVEGQWVWVDGSPLGYRNWDTVGKQPNNKRGVEHYMILWARHEGKWSDQPNDTFDQALGSIGFICQWD